MRYLASQLRRVTNVIAVEPVWFLYHVVVYLTHQKHTPLPHLKLELVILRYEHHRMHLALIVDWLNDYDVPTQEYHVLRGLVGAWLELSQLKWLQKLLDNLYLQMTQMECQVILTQKHLIKLEHVLLPKSLLKLRKYIHYLLNTSLLYWHWRQHRVCSSSTMIYMWHNWLKSKNLTLIVGLLVYSIFVDKLYLATTLENEVKVFCDFPTLQNFLIHIKCLLFGKIFCENCQNSLW